jgi:RNA 2',3'-cyclic 3'-phosphodiesterase
MQPETFRAFWAIDFTAEINQQILALMSDLKRHHAYMGTIKWTKPENLHITMRFLGNITEVQCTNIINDTIASIHDIQTFELNLNAILFFPTPRHPRIIALKAEPITPFILLNKILDDSAIKNDLPADKRAFIPHLTIGRIKTKLATIPSITNIAIKTTATNIKLYRSDPSETGSVYTPIVCIPFI